MSYLPEVAWSTIASNVTLGASAYRYYITVNPLDPNEAGASPMTVAINDWFIDFAGYPFLIEEINGSILTVYDILERGDGITSAYGPYADKLGYVYRPLNGAIILTQAQLRKLDESAKDIIQPIEKGIQWAYRGIRLVSVNDDYSNITRLGLTNNLKYTYTENEGWQGGHKAELDLNIGLGTGALAEMEYTNNGDGTITVQENTFMLYDNANGTGYPKPYLISGGTFSFTDNVYNYIVADYNSGTPIMYVITDVTLINETTIVPVFSVLRRGTILCLTNWNTLGNAKIDKLHQSIVKTQRYRRESGLSISIPSTGTPRRVSLTSGTVWIGDIDISMESVISGDVGVTMFEYYKTGGVWGYSSASQLNNTYYQGTTDRVSLTANRYAVAFVYRGVESNKHLYFVYGTGDYTLAQAQAALVPSDLPIAIRSHTILVGRVIIQKGSDTITELASAFDTVFTIQPIDNHAGLSNLGWTVSGHTATAGSVPVFNSLGVAIEASLTNGYIPYKTTNGLENSPISTDGTNVTIGTLEGLLLGTSGLLSTLSSLDITYGGTGITSYTQGDLLYYNSGNSLSKLNKSTSTNYYLKNSGVDNSPAWASITDADLVLSDITTNNASSSKHGFLPKLPNDTSKWLRGDGSWATISTDYDSFLDSVIRMVVDNSFDPSPTTTGDRYILETTSLHTNFGTITGLGVHDIVQYNGSAFTVVFDASAAASPATVTVGIDINGASNHDWTYNVTDDIWVDRGTTTLHNSLSDLNTGVGQYYHLTSEQHDLVAGITSTFTELNYLDGTTVTSGRILFGDGTKITNDSNLYWDYTNDRLSIGTASATNTLTIIGADSQLPSLGMNGGSISNLVNGTRGLLMGHHTGGNYFLQVQRTDGTATAYNLLMQPNGGSVSVGNLSPTYTLDVTGTFRCTDIARFGHTSRIIGNNTIGSGSFNSTLYFRDSADVAFGEIGKVSSSQNDMMIYGTTGVGVKISTNGSTVAKVYINPSGQVGIGRVDQSYLLDVNGSCRIGTLSGLIYGTAGVLSGLSGTGFVKSSGTTITFDNSTYQPLDATLTSLASVAGVQGDLLYASGTDTWTKLAKSTGTNYYLKNSGTSNNPAWSTIGDADLTLADVTTNNSSASKHGFLKKLNNLSNYYMNGQGNWSIPEGRYFTTADYYTDRYDFITTSNGIILGDDYDNLYGNSTLAQLVINSSTSAAEIMLRGKQVLGYGWNIGTGCTTGSVPTDNIYIRSRHNDKGIYITPDGYLGINVVSPTYAFDLNGTARIGTLNGLIKGTSGVLSAITSTESGTKYLRDDYTWQTVTEGYWSQNGTSIYYNGGNVGIGTNIPTGDLEIKRIGEVQIDLNDNDTQKYRIFARASDSVFGLYDITNNRTWFRYKGNVSVASTTLSLLENGGNVGIGTTNPTRQVTIRKDIANGVGASLMLVNSTYSANSGAETEIIMNHYTGDNNPFRYAKIHTVGANGDGTVDRLSLGLVNSSDTYQDVLTLKYNGNVGIGTTSPNQLLSLQSTNPAGIYLKTNTSGSSNYLAGFVTVESNSDYRGRGIFLPTTDASANDSWYAGVPYTGGAFIIGNSSTHVVQNANGPYNYAAAKVTVLKTGNVGIGTTTPSYKLDVNGTGNFATSLKVGTLSGLIKGTGGVLSAITGTQGDIIYYNGTNWVTLAAGTNGYFLKTQGTGANPIWAAATPFASNSQTIPKNTSSGAWYRIATSAVNVGRCDGVFELEYTVSGYHERLSFRASSMWNNSDSIKINKLGNTKFNNDGVFSIKNTRVVYYPNAYGGYYAYVEVFISNLNTTVDATLYVRMVDAIGWSVTTGAGSIPSGYSSVELSVQNHNPYYSTNDKSKTILPSSGVLNLDLRVAGNENVSTSISASTTINIYGLYDGAVGTILFTLNNKSTITLNSMYNYNGTSVHKEIGGNFAELLNGYYIIAYKVIIDSSGTWRIFFNISDKYSNF